MAKQNNNQMYWILGVVALILFYYGGNAGWFGGDTFFSTINQDTFNQLENAPVGDTCSVTLDKNVITAGEIITGSIKDGANTLCTVYGNGGPGWIEVGSGITNAFGDLSITDTINIPGTYEFRVICGSCVSNTVDLIVNPVVAPPADDGWEVGDVIGSGGNSGLTTGEGFGDIIDLSPGDNPCTLGIRINAEWTSWSDGQFPLIDGECWNPNYQDWQSLYWSFQDSTALRWSDVMNAPPVKTLSADICPAIYDSSGTPWQIQMEPAFDDADFPPPGCQVGYSYNYEIYNCECP